MRDAAHVRSVDAHSEGVGGHHHLAARQREASVHALALGGGESGVVDLGRPARPRQTRALLLAGTPGGRVDEGRAPGLPRPAQEAGIPVWLGLAASERHLPRFAEIADGWMPMTQQHRTIATKAVDIRIIVEINCSTALSGSHVKWMRREIP